MELATAESHACTDTNG